MGAKPVKSYAGNMVRRLEKWWGNEMKISYNTSLGIVQKLTVHLIHWLSS